MRRVVVPIVEGHGECDCVPALVHRIAREAGLSPPFVNPPIRVKASSFLQCGDYFAKYFQMAASKAIYRAGVVLILLDADDDCPAEVGERLMNSARRVRTDVRVVVALAQREYESWFLAAAHSLRSEAGLPDDFTAPENHESIRDAKGWLASHMPPGNQYDPIRHQLLLTRKFSLTEAVANRSFQRFHRKMLELLVRDGE